MNRPDELEAQRTLDMLTPELEAAEQRLHRGMSALYLELPESVCRAFGQMLTEYIAAVHAALEPVESEPRRSDIRARLAAATQGPLMVIGNSVCDRNRIHLMAAVKVTDAQLAACAPDDLRYLDQQLAASDGERESLRRMFETAERDCQVLQARAEAAERELQRLKAGQFSADEIHQICHNLHGTVDAQAFASGCAEEQRRLYGCAPDRDSLAAAHEEIDRLKAADRSDLVAFLRSVLSRNRQLAYWHISDDISALRTRLACIGANCSTAGAQPAVEQPYLPGAVCIDCALPYEQFPLDVILPRPQWMEIHPSEHGLLCATCIVKRAAQVPGVTCVHAILEVAPHKRAVHE